jgi:hypothetical protein
MNNIIKNFLWGLLIFPFFISMFFINHFIFWLLFGFYILLMGILMFVLGLFNRLEKVEGKIKRIFLRVNALIVGVGFLVLFGFVWIPSFLDVSAYLSRDFKTVKGFPNHIDHLSSRSLFQTIEINNIELKSVYEIPEKDFDKEIEAVYLPRSKYVITLWIYR